MTTVGDIGEFGLIDRIKAICGRDVSPDVILGIGDDTAVVRLDETRALVATCDSQVEDVHFRWAAITPFQLGRRALAVNLSDIAAMGAGPQYALVSLAVPPDMPAERFDEFYKGLHATAQEYGVSIIGGNIARTGEKLVIDVFLWGMVDPARMLTRRGAQDGDLIYVTGTLGSAAAGVDVLKRYGPHCSDEYVGLVRAHLEPRPRAQEGIAIAASGVATSMIDVSDGLAADLGHVCAASGVGAEIDEPRLPYDAALLTVARQEEKDLRDYVLHGGEDYELLFTVRPDGEQITETLARERGMVVRRIGRICSAADGIVLIDAQGTRSPLKVEGWDHFKP